MTDATAVLRRRRSLRLGGRVGGTALTWVSLGLIGLLVLVALLAPWIAPYDPQAIDLSLPLSGSSSDHLLGTDQAGRDILSRLIWGTRSSLIGPFVVVAVSTVLGLLVGVVAAWRGGPADAVLARTLDLLFAFPGLLLAILAASMFGAGLLSPIVALTIAYTPWIARTARAAALREKERPYIAAWQVQGMGPIAICLRHLVPNIAPVVIAQAAINLGYVLIDLAAISYLGLGVQPPDADWGLMISEGQTTIIGGAPEQALWTSGMFFVAVISFNVLADGMADRITGRRR